MQDTTFVQLTNLLTAAQPDAHGVVRLPTERALAHSLHVQRSTVRERLASLEALGLIRRAQGSGTYLSLPDSTFVQLYFDTALKLGHFTTAQLEQAREMLEREIVRVAATSATPDDLAMIADALARMLAAGDVAQGDQADYEFHVWLARAAHNPVITLIINGLASVLHEVLQQRRRTIRAVPGGAARTNATHAPILAELRARNPDGAVAAMDAHFRWRRHAGCDCLGTGAAGVSGGGDKERFSAAWLGAGGAAVLVLRRVFCGRADGWRGEGVGQAMDPSTLRPAQGSASSGQAMNQTYRVPAS